MPSQQHAARVLEIGSTFRTIRGVQGNTPELTPAEVALALARAAPDAAAAWRWRYLLDGAVLRPLVQLLEHAACELARRECWHEQLDVALVVRVVLAEEAWPAKRRTDAERARRAGMLYSAWNRQCKKPHARLAAILDVLVGDAERVLARRLADDGSWG